VSQIVGQVSDFILARGVSGKLGLVTRSSKLTFATFISQDAGTRFESLFGPIVSRIVLYKLAGPDLSQRLENSPYLL
jgi:hypothetical protein